MLTRWNTFRRRTFGPSADAFEAGVGDLHQRVAVLGAGFERLVERLEHHVLIVPAPVGAARPRVTQAEVLAALRVFQPASVVGGRKVRVGSKHDGGYVMLDDFDEVTAAFSLGILDDDTWDLALAERGIAVAQYDDSIADAPSHHPKLRFFRSRIGAQGTPGTVSLAAIVGQHAPDRDASDDGADLILKMDIEGSEWEVLETAPTAVLSRFRQILCEFHDLERLTERDFHTRAMVALTNLSRTHQAIHVHGNNNTPIRNIENVPFPGVVEVSFVARRLHAFEPCAEVFPTALDRPNNAARPDLFMGRSFLEADG